MLLSFSVLSVLCCVSLYAQLSTGRTFVYSSPFLVAGSCPYIKIWTVWAAWPQQCREAEEDRYFFSSRVTTTVVLIPTYLLWPWKTVVGNLTDFFLTINCSQIAYTRPYKLSWGACAGSQTESRAAAERSRAGLDLKENCRGIMFTACSTSPGWEWTLCEKGGRCFFIFGRGTFASALCHSSWWIGADALFMVYLLYNKEPSWVPLPECRWSLSFSTEWRCCMVQCGSATCLSPLLAGTNAESAWANCSFQKSWTS